MWLSGGGAVGVALIHVNVMAESTCSTSTESTESTPTPVTEIFDESACSDDSESETTQTSTLTGTSKVETLYWWKGHKQHLPNWSKALEDVLLVQPSSAAAERVFSMLKASFSHQQDHSLQDYIDTSLFLQFNRH